MAPYSWPLPTSRHANRSGRERRGARLAAAVSLVLASAKVRDHVADGDGVLKRRPVALAARRIAGGWDRAGARTGAELGFDTAVLVDAVDRQTGIEALAAPAPRCSPSPSRPRRRRPPRSPTPPYSRAGRATWRRSPRRAGSSDGSRICWTPWRTRPLTPRRVPGTRSRRRGPHSPRRAGSRTTRCTASGWRCATRSSWTTSWRMCCSPTNWEHPSTVPSGRRPVRTRGRRPSRAAGIPTTGRAGIRTGAGAGIRTARTIRTGAAVRATAIRTAAGAPAAPAAAGPTPSAAAPAGAAWLLGRLRGGDRSLLHLQALLCQGVRGPVVAQEARGVLPGL